MKVLLTIITLLLAFSGFAQRQNVYFLKNNGRYVDNKDSADFVRVVREPDSASVLYNVFEFYKDGKKKLIGKSSTIDPPKFEGQCIRFYKSGVKQSLTNYKNGLIVGDDYEFYPNGRTYLVKEYSDNNDGYKDIDYNYLIKENYDSLGTVLFANGNGYYKGYDSNFKYINEEGRVKNGKRDSVWKGCFKDIPLTFIETYKDGELIAGTATYQDGGSATYSKSRGIPPQFNGGLKAFYNYLGMTIRYPTDARKSDVQGRVILTFIVEKNGRISNIVVDKSVSPSIDAEAVRVIMNSPPWIPAVHFGRKVRVTYAIPIKFTLSD